MGWPECRTRRARCYIPDSGAPLHCHAGLRKHGCDHAMNSAQTLLLNQGFEPIKVISWQRAISLLFLGKVEVLEEYDRDVRSVSLVIKVPAVVRLLRAFRRHARPVKFSRVNIYARDTHHAPYW